MCNEITNLNARRRAAKSKTTQSLKKLVIAAKNHTHAMEKLAEIQKDLDNAHEAIADKAVRETLGIDSSLNSPSTR